LNLRCDCAAVVEQGEAVDASDVMGAQVEYHGLSAGVAVKADVGKDENVCVAGGACDREFVGGLGNCSGQDEGLS
jgi:hypothetical protein